MKPINYEMDFLIDDNDKIWYINTNSDGIFYLEKNTFVVHYVKALPDSPQFRLYNSGVKYKQQLFFFPFYADHILVFHIKTGIFEKIECEGLKKEKNQYTISFTKDEKAFAVNTYGATKILIIDMGKKTIEEHLLNEIEQGKLSRDFVVKDDKLYLTMINQAVIYEVNLNDYNINKYVFNADLSGFGTIAENNGLFVLSSVDSIYTWDLVNQCLTKYDNFPKDYGFQLMEGNYIKFLPSINLELMKYEQPFWRSVVVGNEVFFISAVANMSLVFDLNSKLINKMNLGEMETEEILKKYPTPKRKSILKHVMVFRYNDTIICSNSRDESFAIIDCVNKKIDYSKGKIGEKDVCCYLENNKFIEENSTIDLWTWTKFVKGAY